MTAVALVVVAVVIAGCRAGYRAHEERRVPPLDTFWTEGDQ